MLLIVFLFSALGAGMELLLLGHTESPWQWVPLLLIGSSMVTLLIHALLRRAASMRVFQVIMLLFIIGGCVGIWQHYQAKSEFKLEMNPALRGRALLWEAITGATLPPILAPGTMIQMGLLGLIYTHRHPVFTNSTKRTTKNGKVK